MEKIGVVGTVRGVCYSPVLCCGRGKFTGFSGHLEDQSTTAVTEARGIDHSLECCVIERSPNKKKRSQTERFITDVPFACLSDLCRRAKCRHLFPILRLANIMRHGTRDFIAPTQVACTGIQVCMSVGNLASACFFGRGYGKLFVFHGRHCPEKENQIKQKNRENRKKVPRWSGRTQIPSLLTLSVSFPVVRYVSVSGLSRYLDGDVTLGLLYVTPKILAGLQSTDIRQPPQNAARKQKDSKKKGNTYTSERPDWVKRWIDISSNIPR